MAPKVRMILVVDIVGEDCCLRRLTFFDSIARTVPVADTCVMVAGADADVVCHGTAYWATFLYYAYIMAI